MFVPGRRRTLRIQSGILKRRLVPVQHDGRALEWHAPGVAVDFAVLQERRIEAAQPGAIRIAGRQRVERHDQVIVDQRKRIGGQQHGELRTRLRLQCGLRLGHGILIRAGVDRRHLDRWVLALEVCRVAVDDLRDRSANRDREVETDVGRRIGGAGDGRQRQRGAGGRQYAATGRADHARTVSFAARDALDTLTGGSVEQVDRLLGGETHLRPGSQHDAARKPCQHRHIADPAGDHRVGAEIFRKLDSRGNALLGKSQTLRSNTAQEFADRRRCQDRAVGAAHHHAGATPFKRKQVHRRRADEACGKTGRRARIDLCRRCVLLDMAIAQQHDLVGHAHRLGLVMRHVQHGDPQPTLQRQDLAAHVGAKLRIEVRQRFVHQADRRLGNDGAAEGHTLLLAAGKLAGLALQQMSDAEDLDRARQPPRSARAPERGAPAARTRYSPRRSDAGTSA